jgi:hypothetical protein
MMTIIAQKQNAKVVSRKQRRAESKNENAEGADEGL